MNKMLILALALGGLMACSEQDLTADETDTLDQSAGLDGSVTVTPGRDGGADAGRADAGRADAGRTDAGN